MSQEKAKWESWLALSTAIMAVLAALTTLYMGKYSSRTIMAQGEETNQWSYYQAKSIKEHAYEITLKNLELKSLEMGFKPTELKQEYEKTIAKYKNEIIRYEAEKKEIKDKAEKIAKNKKIAQEMGGNFGYSLIFLQISLMLSSIASLTKKRYLWQIALFLNIGWLFFFIDAWLLFY